MKPLTAVAILFVAVTVSAQTKTTRITFAINISQTDCPKLPGNLSGTGQGIIVTTMTVDSNGTAHLSETDAFHGTATAGSDQYVFAHNDTAQLNFPAANLPLTFTSTEKFLLIGQGSAPNLTVVGVFHVTVFPDGTVIAMVDNERLVGSPGCFPG